MKRIQEETLGSKSRDTVLMKKTLSKKIKKALRIMIFMLQYKNVRSSTLDL
jgi:hypothetical protein